MGSFQKNRQRLLSYIFVNVHSAKQHFLRFDWLLFLKKININDKVMNNVSQLFKFKKHRRHQKTYLLLKKVKSDGKWNNFQYNLNNWLKAFKCLLNAKENLLFITFAKFQQKPKILILRYANVFVRLRW